MRGRGYSVPWLISLVAVTVILSCEVFRTTGTVWENHAPDAPKQGRPANAYADHMLTDEFRAALNELMALAASSPTAILCAEAVPRRCHPKRTAGYRYTADSYRRAIARTVELANRKRAEEAAKQGIEPQLLAHWHPKPYDHPQGQPALPDSIGGILSCSPP